MMSAHDRPDVQTTNSSSSDDGCKKVRGSYMGRNSLRTGFGSSRSNIVRPGFYSCACFRFHRVGRSLSSLATNCWFCLNNDPMCFQAGAKDCRRDKLKWDN